MNGTIEQQQQIMRKVYNDQAQRIAELRKALPAGDNDADDGTSTTKGE
jgi:DNA-binding ferritin-like protein